MKKTYLLTLKFKCNISDETSGTGELGSLEKTGQFLDVLRKDDNALLEYYKILLFDCYLHHFGDRETFEKPLGIKEMRDVFLPLTGQVTEEVGEYIRHLYEEGREPRTRQALADWDKKKDLLENQLGPPEIVGVGFKEIK